MVTSASTDSFEYPSSSIEYSKELSNTLYWGYSQEIIGAVEYYKEIYDGSFNNILVDGNGIFTNLCLKNNLKVYSENDNFLLSFQQFHSIYNNHPGHDVKFPSVD